MMIKRVLLFVLLTMPLVANAAVTKYVFQTGYTGGFTFDDSTDIFTDVAIYETLFGQESWTALGGDATGATGFGNVFGIPLIMTFDDVLGSLPIGAAYQVSWVVDASSTPAAEIYTGIDTVVSSVPVPAAAWLFGSALLGLAGVKRKRA